MLNKGRWADAEIIPEEWIDQCLTPCALAPYYGYLWWLNAPKGGMFPGAPTNAYCAMGVGTQIIALIQIITWWSLPDGSKKTKYQSLSSYWQLLVVNFDH